MATSEEPVDTTTPTISAMAAIKEALRHRQVSVAWSGGKDSSVILGLTMQAAQSLLADGAVLKAPILVTHGDTLVENPEIRAYVDGEIVRLRDYAERHAVPLQVHIAKPNLTESWQLRVIGGRALPSFPGTNHDCTTDLKIKPMHRLRDRVVSVLSVKRFLIITACRKAWVAKVLLHRQDFRMTPIGEKVCLATAGRTTPLRVATESVA